MKKILIGVTVLMVVAFLVVRNDRILLTVFSKGAETRIGFNVLEGLDDGLHLVLCGAGGPLPSPRASGPCVLVIAGDRLFVIDAGTNGARNIGVMGFPIGDVESVLLTHFHSDHIDGLGELATLRWVAMANTAPLPVFGPEGVKDVVKGFNTAYQMDSQYRQDHHGDTVAPLSGHGLLAQEFIAPASGVRQSIIDDADLNIDAFRVEHDPVSPAVGYRVQYKDRSLVVTGDTSKSDNVLLFSEGVDLLAHDALAANLVEIMGQAAAKVGNEILVKVTHDIPDYHATPVQAAETAREAGVKHLLYYHIVPPLIFPGQERLFLDGAQDVFSNYTIGYDGTMISLPSDSSEVKTASLL